MGCGYSSAQNAGKTQEGNKGLCSLKYKMLKSSFYPSNVSSLSCSGYPCMNLQHATILPRQAYFPGQYEGKPHSHNLTLSEQSSDFSAAVYDVSAAACFLSPLEKEADWSIQKYCCPLPTPHSRKQGPGGNVVPRRPWDVQSSHHWYRQLNLGAGTALESHTVDLCPPHALC